MPEQEDDLPADPAPGGRREGAAPADPRPGEAAGLSRLPVPPSPALDAAIAALRRGERSEVHEEVLFKSLYRPVATLFSNRGLLPADAADLTQVTLIRVFEHIEHYRSAGALWAWVRRIAMNTLQNHFRDQDAAKRRASLEVPLEPPPAREGEPPPRPDPSLSEDAEAETRVLGSEDHRLLRDALAGLPAGMRQVMVLRLSDLKYEEIAEVLGVSLNTVRSQLHAAKTRLRLILEAHFPEHAGGEER